MSAAVAEPRRHYSDPDKSYIDLDIDSAMDYIFHDTDAQRPANILVMTAAATAHPADNIELQLEAVDSAVDELLEACLGQALCEQKLVEEVRAMSQAAEKRAEPNWTQQRIDSFLAAEALKRRWAKELYENISPNNPNWLRKYCFKRTRTCEVPEAQPISESVQPQPVAPVAPQFTTDESTGECKAQ